MRRLVEASVKPFREHSFYTLNMKFVPNTDTDYVREVFMPFSVLLIPVAFVAGFFLGYYM